MRALELSFAALSLVACKGSSFNCSDNENCSLGGDPGLCIEGNCAYGDDACPSGYRYAEGLDSLLAGQCVPEDDVQTTGTGADSSTGSMATGSSGTTTDQPLTTAMPTSMPTSMPMESGSFVGPGTADTGAVVCEPDVYDTGASTTFPVGGCGSVPSPDGLIANLHAPDDVDEYTFEYVEVCPGLQHATFVESRQPMRVCTYADCGAGAPCIAGTTADTSPGGFEGCCSEISVSPTSGFEPIACQDATVVIAVVSGNELCADYRLFHGL